jgi:hypothetical protein
MLDVWARRMTPREVPMANAELHELLRRLHEELGRATSLDDEARRLVGVLAADLRRVATRETPSVGAGGAPSASEAEAVGSPGGIEELAVRFEAEHPAVASTLRQVADVLGKAGI